MGEGSAVTNEMREKVAQACRVLGALDLTPSTYGHVSARLPGSDRILVRARGPAETGVRYTTAADVIEVDLDGARVGAAKDGYAPPLEIFIHTELYRARPEVNAVVHTHPASAVLLTVCDKPLQPIYGAFEPFSLRYALAGVPTYPRSILIRRPELGRELAACMGSSEVCLMHGHGITTAANSVEEATLAAIHLESLTSMTCQAITLGGARPLPPEEQEEFRAMGRDADYGEPQPGVPSGRIANLWRYYVRLAEERLR